MSSYEAGGYDLEPVDGDPYSEQPVGLAGASRSFRNNNPGNLKFGNFAQAQGAIGKDANGFAIFPDIDTGTTAQRNLWSTTYADRPVGDVVRKAWVTPGGGQNYTQKLGIDPNQTFAQLEPQQQQGLLEAQKKFEGYYPPPGLPATSPVYLPPPQPTQLASLDDQQ
jgi:hypothetical protein